MHARFYGIKYWNGERTINHIAKIPGVNKRGIWQFDVNDTFSVDYTEFQNFKKNHEKKERITARQAAKQEAAKEE
eukprot:CAMPEP_0170491620 /NCGR_PEP_ID=MMETSP0208-20121228/11156_1 /TAXON_ID=197538 /ORGANISM="Strombidium inclinatum, Strain S3" /LENGTH=74 /DNA_ID=CAMNT_0010767221 /DNA_START=249 /DNA_END=470 /DNA_ORIENTATION=-